MWLIVPSSGLDCAPVPEDLNSLSKSPSPDIEQSVWWNGKFRSPVELRRAFSKDRSLSLLNGMTLPASMAAAGVESFISSLRASLASRGALPESAKARRTKGGSGRRSRASSKNPSPTPSSSRTFPDSSSIPIATWTRGKWKSSQMNLLGEWQPYSGTWPGSGSMRSGVVFERPTPALRTAESESLSSEWQTPATDSFRSRGGDRVDEMGLDQEARRWATPRAEDGESAGNHPNASDSLTGQTKFWKTPHGQGNRDATGKAGGAGGGEFAKEANNWMSPSAGDSKGRKYTYDQHDKTKPRAALEGQANTWNTPDTSNRFGNRQPDGRRSLGLNTQANNWPTPDANAMNDGESAASWIKRAEILKLKHTNGNGAGMPLTVASLLFQSSRPAQTTPDGTTCWCGSPGCALPSHKRKLNPIFETWLMGWPLWWLVSVPEASGRSEMVLYLSRQRRRLFFLLGDSLQSANDEIPQPTGIA